ncbi:MAG: dihydrolipoyl dehydrogenase [Armatimonadetes bacterium]|nr:dihydrolipoyl dehydrogenase [Armatimonadota bacterium]
MPEPYDLVVIGAGPGGYVGAIRAAQLGLRIALIERDKVGGTCLHYGCIPTKAMLHTAEALDHLRGARDLGITLGDLALDLGAVHARKARVVDQLHKGTQFLMRKNKIDVFNGEARFLTDREVGVALADGSETAIAGKHFLIATGSAPRSVPGITIDNDRILDSTGALALQAVPRRLAILGAGAVGVEFASLFRAFGAEVTLVELLPAIVPLEDEEIGQQLQRAFERRGITVHPGTTAEAVERHGDELALTLRKGGESSTVPVDYLLVAVGRAPVLKELAPEEAGVALDRGAVTVDDDLRTSVAHIFAIGDVLSRPFRLAHVASDEAIAAVETIAGEERAPIDYGAIPRPTFCIPQVATMGLSERQAREAGRDVKVGRFPFQANSKATIEDATEGLVKVVADAKLGEILGIHMIGAGVTELLAEGVAARYLEGTLVELGSAVHSHPTLSEALKEASLNALGRAIHI